MEDERVIRMYELARGPLDQGLTLPEGYEIVGAQWNSERKILQFFIKEPKHPVVLARTINVDDLLSGRLKVDPELKTIGTDEPIE